MSLLDIAKKRYSVRKYEDKPVEKEKIMEILKAGMQAPSACNQQPWEFYVVTDKEKIQKLSKVTPYTGCAAGAPAVIVPVYHTEGLVAPSFAQIDMSIAQENIWLETDTLGLGGVWFGIAPVEEHMEKVHRLLDLPENVKVFGYDASNMSEVIETPLSTIVQPIDEMTLAAVEMLEKNMNGEKIKENRLILPVKIKER